MTRFKDQIAIITGSASGIGKEIALAFVKEGATVVIADLKMDAAQKTADEIMLRAAGLWPSKWMSPKKIR
ncbi:hypothetical protein JCM17846_23550 [Iodidimonas nitroreducens]|uniref:Uncharacterized protein n=1 Tax=Iodidimonas nitroreducens TaxID=1236968 RepID=A0A5A7N8K0_9PROT|nr:SDR family NAD(P)-dependent oxidoreductase [Iodidimonas nitroreducens]GER04673.1 hypothetical protein JCM17846_23550 [Iodidimonas nitroreducens]